MHYLNKRIRVDSVYITLSLDLNDMKTTLDTCTESHICVGFGILFIGLNLMTGAVKPLSETDAFKNVFGESQECFVRTEKQDIRNITDICCESAADFSGI